MCFPSGITANCLATCYCWPKGETFWQTLSITCLRSASGHVSRKNKTKKINNLKRESRRSGWGWSPSGRVICDILRSWVTSTTNSWFFLCVQLSFRINLLLLCCHTRMRVAYPERSHPEVWTTKKNKKTKRLRSSASSCSTHPHCCSVPLPLPHKQTRNISSGLVTMWQ